MNKNFSLTSTVSSIMTALVISSMFILIFQKIWKRNIIKLSMPSGNNVITAVPSPANGQNEEKQVKRMTYFVSTYGNDSNDGISRSRALNKIQRAIDMALPGDTIYLMPGIYFQDAITKRSGTLNNPITIDGTKEAIVKGGGSARILEVNHDYITVNGFTIDGLYSERTKAKNYRDKLIYALGKSRRKGVVHLKITNMDIKNAGGECIRLRYFAQQNEISNNRISWCGAVDFLFNGGGKNGEGIYIGTAPEQLGDGKNPTKDRDRSNNNWIHHNVIDTQGNECVDIKEGSLGTIVEYNSCTGQKDKNSGGFDSRGNNSVFRYNEIFENSGAGIRLGGDKKNDGINNDIQDNIIRNNLSGGIKVQRRPQGRICSNTMDGNTNGNSVGLYRKALNPTVPCS